MTEWYMKKWICANGVEERTKYPVSTDTSGGGDRRERKRAAERASRKADTAARQMGRLMNENFRAGTDHHVVLEYDDRELERIQKRAAGLLAGGKADNETDALFIAAQVNASNFIRRVQREIRRTGAARELKYILVTADMDGETGEMVRIHHHLIISGVEIETVRRKWRAGSHVDKIFTVHGDLSALAEYLAKQVRPVAGTKTYCPSRNLRQPRCTEPVLVSRWAESEMRVPKGCLELYRSPYIRGRSQYLRYYRPPGAGDPREGGDK